MYWCQDCIYVHAYSLSVTEIILSIVRQLTPAPRTIATLSALTTSLQTQVDEMKASEAARHAELVSLVEAIQQHQVKADEVCQSHRPVADSPLQAAHSRSLLPTAVVSEAVKATKGWGLW